MERSLIYEDNCGGYMNILYISYSCDPFNGSEDQIGWNIPIECANRGNSVYVLTKAEHKQSIQKYISSHENNNISFQFIDVSKIYKKLFKGLFYSLRIIVWQKKALKAAKKICNDNDIEIIHQVAPVEYRAIGNYGKLKKVKFVAGPIGGGFPIPREMRKYTRGHIISELLRKIANTISLLLLKFNRRIAQCDYLYLTNVESRDILNKFGLIHKNASYSFLCDVGTNLTQEFIKPKKNDGKFVFLVPGRLYYRKGHRLLFDAIKTMPNKNFIFRIVGSGPDEKKLKKIVSKNPFLKKHVFFVGKIDYSNMRLEYENCNSVVLPSFSEATGTVLIEALSFSKPIITSDHFGAHFFKDFNCGWFYSGNDKKSIVEELKKSIIECMSLTEELYFEKCVNAYKCAAHYSWKNKVTMFVDTYKNLLNGGEN